MGFPKFFQGVGCIVGILMFVPVSASTVPLQIWEEPIPGRFADLPSLPQLEILSRPSQAEVYLEDDLIGFTPLLKKELFPAIYRLRVQKAGYQAKEFRIPLKTGIKTRVQVELASRFGTLALQNLTIDSLVYIDGDLVKGPIHSLPIGVHDLKVRRFGYEDVEGRITIREGETLVFPLIWNKVPILPAELVESVLGISGKGLSSLLSIPETRIAPPHSIRVSSMILGSIGSESPETTDALAHLGISVSLTERLLISPSLSAFLEAKESPPDWIGSIEVQYLMNDVLPGVLLSFYGIGTYESNPRLYGFGQIPGMSVGLAVEKQFQSGGILLSPTLTLFPTILGSLHGRAFVEIPPILIGISSGLRGNFSTHLALPVSHVGIELHWELSTLPLTIHGTAAWVRPLEAGRALYIGGGIEVSF